MFELDNIIRLEIINHTNITAISDSDPDSGDSDTDQNFSTVGLNKLDYNYKHRNYRETIDYFSNLDFSNIIITNMKNCIAYFFAIFCHVK
jgi:hypothetical protein